MSTTNAAELIEVRRERLDDLKAHRDRLNAELAEIAEAIAEATYLYREAVNAATGV